MKFTIMLTFAILLSGCTFTSVTTEESVTVIDLPSFATCQRFNMDETGKEFVISGCPLELGNRSLASPFVATFDVPRNLTGLHLNVSIPLEAIGKLRITIEANGTKYALDGVGHILADKRWDILPITGRKMYAFDMSVCDIEEFKLQVEVAGQYAKANIAWSAYLPVSPPGGIVLENSSSCSGAWDARPLPSALLA